MTDRTALLAVLAFFLFAALPASASLSARAAGLPDGTKILRDVAYGNDPEQRMDVYIPEGTMNAPVILMVHGGAWFLGDKAMPRMYESKAARWLPQGFIFVSMNYRLAPGADALEQAADVASAVAAVQEKASEWGGDPSRVVPMGHSAGAHLVALALASPAIMQGQGAKPVPGAVILDSAALDLPSIMEAPHYRFYDRVFGDDPAYWREASPLHRLAGTPPPLFVVCSTGRDDACPNSESFVAAVRASGGEAALLRVDLSHREINEELGTAGAYTDAVDAFFRSLGLP